MLPEWVGGIVNICHYGWVGLLIYGGGVVDICHWVGEVGNIWGGVNTCHVTGWMRLLYGGGIVNMSLCGEVVNIWGWGCHWVGEVDMGGWDCNYLTMGGWGC